MLFHAAMNVSTNISLKLCFCYRFRSGTAGLDRHFYPRLMNEETEAQRTPVACPKLHVQEAAQPVSISISF